MSPVNMGSGATALGSVGTRFCATRMGTFANDMGQIFSGKNSFFYVGSAHLT
jgi:hypothetical protein